MWQYPLIQELHKETQKNAGISADPNKWPDSWKEVEYKEYPRFEKFILPQPQNINTALSQVLSERESKRRFNGNRTISAQEISDFLYWSAGIKKNQKEKDSRFWRRNYPSGGARYPLELYLSFYGNESISRGVYHYNIKNHSLEHLLDKKGEEKIRKLPTYEFAKGAPLIIYISSIFDRSMR